MWKFFLLGCAVVIGVSSLLYTNSLVGKLKNEESKKIKIWAEIYRLLDEADVDDPNLDFYLQVMEKNTTIPVMIVDKNQELKFGGNIDSVKLSDKKYVARRLEQMKTKYNPIILELYDDEKHYVYYDDSNMLTQLSYYPFIQLGIIFLFIGVAYIAFNTSRKSEQNRVWVGLSKETAHQLGTPISSLLAIAEMLKMQLPELLPNPPHDGGSSVHALVEELEKDITRLHGITERFSKIGSKPATPMTDIGQAIANSLMYIRKRSSDKVTIRYNQSTEPTMIPLCEPLFSWVIENLCKNALDAMGGVGVISVEYKQTRNQVIIDVSDTGKGISMHKFKTIFTPGYTTKSRGWGLGLPLTKRIVEDYHNGRIFVLRSDAEHGTTFRIILKTDLKIVRP